MPLRVSTSTGTEGQISDTSTFGELERGLDLLASGRPRPPVSLRRIRFMTHFSVFRGLGRERLEPVPLLPHRMAVAMQIDHHIQQRLEHWERQNSQPAFD